MTRDETVKIIRIISASYPNFKPDSISEMVDAWAVMLEDYSYQEISLALKAYITSNNSGFAPSIGQLIEKLHTITTEEPLSDMEAWALVSAAIRNSGYNSQKEFDKLPELVQKAVGTPAQLHNWAMSDEDSVESVVQSNFIKTFRVVVQRDKEYRKMPSDIRKLIENVNKDRPAIYKKPDAPAIEEKKEPPQRTLSADELDERMRLLREKLGLTE